MGKKSDRIWRWIIYGTFGTLFALAILGLIRGLAYGQKVEFKITPNPAHPGDLVLFEVAGINQNSKITMFADYEKINFFWLQDRFIGLLAISLDQEPGLVPIINRIKLADGRIYYDILEQLDIKSKKWPERHVGETPPLSPKKMARYLKEKSLVKKALETTLPIPLWKNGFGPPLLDTEATSPFGQKRIGSTKTRQHRGVDLRAHTGEPVFSMNSGRIVLTGNFLADGKIVIVDHGLGLHTLYLHLSRIKVKKWQMIKRGQVLGLSGNTGFSEGPHLHLEVRLNGEAVDPLQILEILK